MNYEEYKFEVVLFDELCVFADLGVSGDESGGIVVHSVGPDVSDS